MPCHASKTYTHPDNPYAVTHIRDTYSAHYDFGWDANGNLENSHAYATHTERSLCWTEDCRLQAFMERGDEGGIAAWYNYSADGNRNIKLTSPRMHMSQNASTYGNPPLIYPTLYASPLITLTQRGYTKHYFEEGRRVCSRLGRGFRDRVPDAEIDARVEEIKRNYAEQLEQQQTGMGKTFGNCIGVNPVILSMFDLRHMLHEYAGDEHSFFYHSNHLGPAAYLTDDAGLVTQTLNYLPYGEDWVDIQNNLDPNLGQYRFNGKEKDWESGFHYYGARYYWSETLTGWLSVDPMTDKYPSISPYAYCMWNPITLIDPDGREIGDYYTRDGKWVGRDKYNDNKVYVCDGKDENGNYINPQDLGVTHDEFCTIANIVSQESLKNEEDLWIAHTANNSAKKRNMSLYRRLMSGYSSVKKENKTPLASSNKSLNANSARAAVINVLTGGIDPTGGAVLWDGTDFLAWGINQAKFKQYKSITISANIYNTYFRNNIAAYLSGITYRINNKKITYQLPADIFIDPQNWKGNTFKYTTGARATGSIEATGAVGLSIFWKIKH